jgi:geranylgeranyl diphosphate synthase type II
VGGDIKDNKKTYVYLKALELADESQKQELFRLFSTTPANEKEKFLAVKNIFDAVNVKEATEEAIALYTAKCIDDINRIHTEEQKKAFVLSLVNSLQSRNK